MFLKREQASNRDPMRTKQLTAPAAKMRLSGSPANSSIPYNRVHRYVGITGARKSFQVAAIGGTALTASQSDATRSRNLEYQIQSRVTSELEKLQAAEQSRLAEISESLSNPSQGSSSGSSADSEPRMRSPLLTEGQAAAAGDASQNQENSHDSVQAEIASLKKKLEGRKKLDQADRGVEEARNAVIQCLRTNDRRPLDCWKEVEAFRKEVGRLEKDFMERTVR